MLLPEYIMLSFVMLRVVILSVVMPSVVMLGVLAPELTHHFITRCALESSMFNNTN